MDRPTSAILEDIIMTVDDSGDTSNIVQRPINYSAWRCLTKGVGHWKCFCLTVLIYTSLGVITWCQIGPLKGRLTGSKQDSMIIQMNPFNGRNPPVSNPQYSASQDASKPSTKGPCDSGYIFIPVSFLILLYLIYLLECWNCPTRLELLNVVSVDVAYGMLEELRESCPILWWKVVCYHYIRRHRNPTRYRNGSTFSASPYYYERVTSFCSSAGFDSTMCGYKDASRKVTGLEDNSVIRMDFSKAYSFSCPEAEAYYEAQRRTFYAEYEALDDYMETREGIDLLNLHLPDTLLVVSDVDRSPCFLSPVLFFVASVFLLSWPLRVFINCKTAYIRFHVHKIFGYLLLRDSQRSNEIGSSISQDLNPNSANYPAYYLIPPHYNLPPSYSEALRLCHNESFIHGNDDDTIESHELSDLPSYSSQERCHRRPHEDLLNNSIARNSCRGRWNSLGSIDVNRLKQKLFRGYSLRNAPASTGSSSNPQQNHNFQEQFDLLPRGVTTDSIGMAPTASGGLLPTSTSLSTPSWAKIRHFPGGSNVPRSKSLFTNLSRSFRKLTRSSLQSSRISSEENILLLRPSATVVRYTPNANNDGFDQTFV